MEDDKVDHAISEENTLKDKVSNEKHRRYYMATKVCIIGGGNGAFAAAADLTLRGYRITIYVDERYKHNY